MCPIYAVLKEKVVENKSEKVQNHKMQKFKAISKLISCWYKSIWPKHQPGNKLANVNWIIEDIEYNQDNYPEVNDSNCWWSCGLWSSFITSYWIHEPEVKMEWIMINPGQNI